MKQRDLLRILLAAVVAACVWSASGADGLRRRGMLGMAVGLSDETKPADPDANPVVVKQVIPGSAAVAAGLEAGDIVRSADHSVIRTTADLTGPRRYAGDNVQLIVSRHGQELTRNLIVKPRPLETSPDAEVLYSFVAVQGSKRRTIVTRPKREGKLPAVLLIGGLGCYSLDGASRGTGYGRVISALEKAGYVTMRVEKTGEGDSEGIACSDLRATPQLEGEGYVAGLRALKQYAFVDPDRVFIFAHSLGPVIGSLVAPEERVRGFIAVETIGTSWYEYDLERSRLQNTLMTDSADAADAETRDYLKCSYRFYIGKETPDELKKTPTCAAMFEPFGAVPYTYMQALNDIRLAAQWKKADVPVLVIYGTASPVTTANQSRYLADTINRLHPGRATYVEVPGMGHDFNRYESQREYMKESQTKPHPFHEGLMEAVMDWLSRHAEPRVSL